jgi:hypothetical protein
MGTANHKTCNVRGYIVRFVRADGKKDEIRFFWDRESALDHMNSYRKDTSGRYKQIEVISEYGMLQDRIAFYNGQCIPFQLPTYPLKY